MSRGHLYLDYMTGLGFRRRARLLEHHDWNESDSKEG